MKVPQFGPSFYFDMTHAAVAEIANGCGTAGWKGKIVPDTIYGVCVTDACSPHDVGYEFGATMLDKIINDCILFCNLFLICAFKGSPWLLLARTVRCAWYLLAVYKHGNKAFWVNKKVNSDMKLTFDITVKMVEV